MSIAKIVEPIFGNEIYQKRARAALPLLVLQTEYGKPITYSELGEKLTIHHRKLGPVLSCIGQSLDILAKKWDEPIPPIQCLVINKNTLLPGPGFDDFLKSKIYSILSSEEKRNVIKDQQRIIYSYSRWNEVLKEFSLLPATRNIFERGKTYSRKDIYKILGIPVNTKGGNWDTGYAKHKDDWFIFCNLGVPGRTGHDYGNRFDGEDLIWFGKTHTKVSHSTIQDLIKPKGKIYVFCRNDNNIPFTYIGSARALNVDDTSPVRIVWKFDDSNEPHPEILPEEETDGREEGALKRITVNAYERNPQARAECLRHYGHKCSVCRFDFYEEYGEIGKDFIHVHHLKRISEIRKKYVVDPIKDLRPVCPNCHAMIHAKKLPYSIDELKTKLRKR